MVLRNSSFSFLSLFIKEVGETVPRREGCVEMCRNNERSAENSVAGVGGIVGPIEWAAVSAGASVGATEPRAAGVSLGDRGLVVVAARGAGIGAFSDE